MKAKNKFSSYWFSCGTWPSVDAKVRSSSLTGLPKEDRVPRIHIMAERRMAKLRRNFVFRFGRRTYRNNNNNIHRHDSRIRLASVGLAQARPN